MKLYVTKRAEPDRRLEFARRTPHWLPLIVFVLGIAVGVIVFWAMVNGP